MNHGERWINHMKNALINTNAFWVDANIPTIVDFAKAKGSRIVHTYAMQPFGPQDAQCSRRTWERPANAICYNLTGCRCAEDPRPISWHLKWDPGWSAKILD